MSKLFVSELRIFNEDSTVRPAILQHTLPPVVMQPSVNVQTPVPQPSAPVIQPATPLGLPGDAAVSSPVQASPRALSPTEAHG
jgi:hypothetical protein